MIPRRSFLILTGGGALLALLWAQAPSPLAQQPPSPQRDTDLVLHVSVNLVQVDAVVTDRSGRHVSNLKADDFEILQDGKPQKITHFSYIALQPAAAPAPPRAPEPNAPVAPPVMLRPDQVRRTIALVVDDLGLSFESMAQARQALKKFVDQQVQPGDLVAIIRTGAGMWALQQFTSDKRQLSAAVERVRWNPLGRGGTSAFAPLNDDGSVDDAAAPPTGADLDSFREEYFSVGTLGALNFIIRGLRDLPGRKSVVLLSDNLRIFNREGYSDRVLESLRSLTDLANRASVVIYTIDARGLPTLGFSAQDRVNAARPDRLGELLQQRHADYFDSQDGLNYLAQETGGFFIHDTNDIGGGIQKVLEDQTGYYLLGYNPDPSTFDAKTGRRLFHKISVRVKPAGLHVRSRTGFYGTPDEEARPAPRTRDQQLFAALASPFGVPSGIHLKLTALFADHARIGSFVQSLLYIDSHDLTFSNEPEGWHKAAVDVLVMTFGENGAEIDHSNRTFTIRARNEDYQTMIANGLVYTINHPIKKPGAYQFRTALRDATSAKVGSASQFIEVPDLNKGRLALSGIVVRAIDPAKQEAAQSGQGAAAASEGQAAENDPQGNPAVRVFHLGRQMVYAYQILNAQVDRATQKPQLVTQVRLFRDGKQIYAGKPAPFDPAPQTDWKHLLAAGRLRLGRPLVPGEYVLQVVVTDPLAKEKYRTATQWIDFEVIP